MAHATVTASDTRMSARRWAARPRSGGTLVLAAIVALAPLVLRNNYAYDVATTVASGGVMSAGGPGSKSNTSIVGLATSGALANEVWSSSEAICAIHLSESSPHLATFRSPCPQPRRAPSAAGPPR